MRRRIVAACPRRLSTAGSAAPAAALDASLRRLSTAGSAAPAAALDAFRRHGHLRTPLSPLRHAGVRRGDCGDALLLPARGAFPSLDAAYVDASIGYEFMHCATARERDFVAAAAEAAPPPRLSPAEARNAASLMLRAHELEVFLSSRYPGLKQYAGSGTEALLPAVEAILAAAATAGVTSVVAGQAHRGRLALLVALLQHPARALFAKLDGRDEIPASLPGLDDVASHIAVSTDLSFLGAKLHVSLLPNPSHLEAVNPVVLGKARAQRDEGVPVLPLLIHGDAAFAGQGVVAECFQLARTPGFDTGGTLHVITNNLLGFTASADIGRSTTYASDVAKAFGVPVFHVNAEDVSAVVAASRLALAYRQEFKLDAIVDLVGYRRQGHNEVDEPAFTSPQLYEEIKLREPHALAYADTILGRPAREALSRRLVAHLDSELKAARGGSGSSSFPAFSGKWAGLRPALVQSELLEPSPPTGIATSVLREIGRSSVALPPPPFRIHERLQRSHVQARLDALAEDREAIATIDWATAETLAFGTLIAEGRAVRLSGQDVERGTFSQRHAVLHDQAGSSLRHVALGSRLRVHSSLLSEASVLGFEYGVSLEDPRDLVLWEAQFGDFANCAQSVIDTFVASGESKWLRSSGLVLLLPHGQDGAGPEHSSARIERFLQLCNGEAWATAGGTPLEVDRAVSEPLNMVVAQPTTPANLFHLLRRQTARPFRKPLVVATPKQLLRLPDTFSRLDELGPGTRFEPVLGDASISDALAGDVDRVILCSGKLFYELDAARRAAASAPPRVAIVRIEELAPWPSALVAAQLARFSNAREVVWAQDEPANAGAWAWARMHLDVGLLRYIGRPALAAAAFGLKQRHAAAQQDLIARALALA